MISPANKESFYLKTCNFDEFVLPYVSTRTDLSADSDSSYFSMFHEFSEHQNGHSSVVTPPDNSTECSIPPTADFFHELSLMQPISSDLQQLGPSNTTPNSLVSVSNSTKSAPHAAATPDNQLYHSPNTLSPFTQLAANSLSLDQSVDVQDQTHTQQITDNTHHMLTRTKTHAMTNPMFHTLFIASI